MPQLSTHMHFGKIFIENYDEKVDIQSFLIGLAAPDTFYDEDSYEVYHYLDDEGNSDVREFYEKFDLKKLSLEEKSIIVGYYCHLWLDEYYRFNASKLIIHNTEDMTDDELSIAIKTLIEYYDIQAVGSYFDKIKNTISNCNTNIKIDEIDHINIKQSKEKLLEFLNKNIENKFNTGLIEQNEYIDFISKSCKKIVKSL